MAYARSTSDTSKCYRIDGDPILLGDLCEEGYQLRPDIVWFGEATQNLEEARQHVATASKILVVGTSLTVQPAASLVKNARGRAEKVLISLDMEKIPYGFKYMLGKATAIVPTLAQEWIECATSNSNIAIDTDSSAAGHL